MRPEDPRAIERLDYLVLREIRTQQRREEGQEWEAGRRRRENMTREGGCERRRI
jgi:hypothetical protein